jgi:hypothetical protein
MIFDWFWNLFKPSTKNIEVVILEEVKPTKKPVKKVVAKKRVPAKGIVAAKKKAVKKVTK